MANKFSNVNYLLKHSFLHRMKLSMSYIAFFCVSRYMQTNKLGCHIFIDAGRRSKIPGSETKDFFSHDIAINMSFTFTLVPLDLRCHGVNVLLLTGMLCM